jgi:hypothetical protein
MSGKLSKSDKKLINDQAVIRAMSPPGRDTAKWLSRLARITPRSARFWSEQNVPVYRREELYLLMIEEYHRVTKWREEELWPALCRGAGLVNGDGVESVESVTAPNSLANRAADLIDATADCLEAAFDWMLEED